MSLKSIYFEILNPKFQTQPIIFPTSCKDIHLILSKNRRRNYNYGAAGDGIKQDLLNHPEYVEQNATIAFQAAMWRWMTPLKKGQPSAHDAFVGNWKPTKNDTLSKRVPGFGITMNILYGDYTCGQGEIDPMNNIISHYLYYLDLMGIGREEGGTHEVLSCSEQVPFNPSKKASSSWTKPSPYFNTSFDTM